MSRRHQHQRLAGVLVAALAIACADEPGSETPSDPSDEATPRPNWHQDVAPIVHMRCVGCHRDGGLAPFALADYDAASNLAPLIVEAVVGLSMPPWGAHDTPECQPGHRWSNDLRLEPDERQALLDWVILGTPEGDAAAAAPLLDPPVRSLEDPSAVLSNPTPVVLEGKADQFVCFSLDPGLAEDVWITGAELLPDNEQVVHHALIKLDEAGASAALVGPDGRFPCDQLHLATMLGSYFPGTSAIETPAQVGVPFPVGARVVVNYHYHPTSGGVEVDQSSLALRWTNEAPAYEALISSIGNATTAAGGLLPGPNDPDGVPTFLVPSGAKGHTETMEVVVPEWLPEAELFMIGPHMHELGVDFRVTLERDGDTRCLLQDPSWDPDWQLAYAIDAPVGSLPRLRAGDRLTLRCTYDNSLDNPSVVEALAHFGLDQPIDARMGSAGLDEMCMLVYGLVVPR